MVEKISVEIALEGGAEVESQLLDIGRAGTKAFGEISQAAQQVDLSSASAQFDDLANAGQEAFAKIQKSVQTAVIFEQIVQGVQKVQGAFETLGVAATKLGARLTRSLGPLGVVARTFGPIGIAVGLAAGAVVKGSFSIANAINEINAAASKLGLTIEQFDKLRSGFVGAGISSEAVTSGLAHLQGELDKLDLERVKKAFEEIQKFREGGGVGFAGLDILREAAKGIGAAAEFAREKLKELGEPIPEGAAEGLKKLGIEGGKLTEIVPQIIQKLQKMPDSVERTSLAIQVLGERLGIELIGALRTGSLAIDQFKRATGTLTQEQQIAAAQQQQAINRMSEAWKQFLASVAAPIVTPVFETLTQEITLFQRDIQDVVRDLKEIWSALQAIDSFTFSVLVAAWNAVKTAVSAASIAISDFIFSVSGITWETIGNAGVQAWNAIKDAVWTAGSVISNFVSSLANITWDAISSAGVAAWDALTSAIQSTIDKLLEFIGMKPSGGAPAANEAGSAAHGGLIGGRGTGTSDSNLAWVSRGEHVMPARAVRQPGMLAFLEALRRSGGNLSRVLDGMGRFALGGLVPRPMPAFAAGGLARGMSNVTIQFPGVPPVGGLRASSAVVDELRKSAALAQVRSGGRKPSRYS